MSVLCPRQHARNKQTSKTHKQTRGSLMALTPYGKLEPTTTVKIGKMFLGMILFWAYIQGSINAFDGPIKVAPWKKKLKTECHGRHPSP
jgi:hypothetical protein